MKFRYFLAALTVGLACGNGGSGDTESASAPSVPDTVVISVVDTIGVLFGDSLREFGSLADVEFDRGGNILALDALKGRITVFGPEGDFIGYIGRHGAGPGEFQYPNCFAQLSDGRLIVSDFSGSTLSFFDENGEFTERVEGFPLVPPMFPVPLNDGTFYAGCMAIDFSIEGELPTGNAFIGIYSGSLTPDEVMVSFPLTITIAEDGDVNVDNVDVLWDSDNEGNLYWAVSDTETYAIHGVSSTGEEFFTVEKSWEPVPKSEEELQEAIYTEGLSRGDEGESTVNRGEQVIPEPNHLAISGLFVDDRDNIWVAQGYTAVPTFEIYSPAGELEGYAVIPELEGVTQLRYCLKNGMLAFDYGPVDYPKIYVLEAAGDSGI